MPYAMLSHFYVVINCFFAFYLWVYGVKGYSSLSQLPLFDIIWGTGVDYMHQSILGIGRQLLRLWFLPKKHSYPWCCGQQIKSVDKGLLNIHPPTEMQRLPRSLKDTLKFWKGEFECMDTLFLLFNYSVMQSYMHV